MTKTKSCGQCENGVIETGNNDLPCTCPLGAVALFNTTEGEGVRGAKILRELNPALDLRIYDVVTWGDRFPSEEMREKYGEGPFVVVGIRLHGDQALQDRRSFPFAITITLNDKDTPPLNRQEFSGGWFKKI